MTHPDTQHYDDIADTVAGGLTTTRTEEISVPEKWSFETDAGDETVEFESRAFVGDKVAFGRVVRLDGGLRAQTVGMVVAPRLATTLPLLCFEMHSTEAGVELVLLDLFQTAASDVSVRLKELLREVRRDIADAFSLEDVSERAEPLFGEAAIVMTPKTQARTGAAEFTQRLLPVLEEYTAAIGRFEPTVMRGIEQRRQRRADYLSTFVEEAPLRALLEQLRDVEWVDDYIEQFLYPTWLHAGDTLPPWDDRVG
jgi:hypothetical protein